MQPFPVHGDAAADAVVTAGVPGVAGWRLRLLLLLTSVRYERCCSTSVHVLVSLLCKRLIVIIRE